ncbi:hypothetical protein CWB73_10000 [Pseudoalteromonas phenolica]|uniref:PAS domain-containing protein n=1 Tax=Pseudoalteromonas phenolica TaxID=161398 RepID=A0A5S3YTI0_9GAMM|nr:PAS domain-containing protein [Pseudoalteromonas phenolica]TMP80740.1 hypothetical protein CWB73_10000 [Pseudoalteromonas phenolica]
MTYENDAFCEVSGYNKEEIYGKPHNLVRQNDVPKLAFANLWVTIESGKSWMGPVENQSKDGRFYWVCAFVTKIKHELGPKQPTITHLCHFHI